MKKLASIAAIAVLAGTAGAQAMDWGQFYAKLYGGYTASEDSLAWGAATYPIDAGGILGGSIGLFTGIDGLSVEFDITGASADYTGYDTSYDALTVMGNVVFTAPVADRFSVYGGVGAGAVLLSYNSSVPADAASGTGFGGQAFAGVSFGLTDNFSIFGEARYQAAAPISVTDGGTYGTYDMDYHHTSILAGIKISN